MALAYSSPSVNRSRMSFDLKKRFCRGSLRTCSSTHPVCHHLLSVAADQACWCSVNLPIIIRTVRSRQLGPMKQCPKGWQNVWAAVLIKVIIPAAGSAPRHGGAFVNAAMCTDMLWYLFWKNRYMCHNGLLEHAFCTPKVGGSIQVMQGAAFTTAELRCAVNLSNQ